MSSRGGVVLILALVVLAGASGAASDVPDSGPLVLHDPEGDSGNLPCSSASDLLGFTAEWSDVGVLLHYTFRDLSVVTSGIGIVYDAEGRCFYSHTDFVAEFGSETVEGSVYIDHVAFPQYTTGWRVYLHEDRTDLPATIDGNTINVTLPYEILGQPAPGDRFGDIRIQASSDLSGHGLRETDWAPDDSRPCGCWLTYPGQ